MNIILHDYNNHLTFAPLSLTRPVGNLRMGMWTNDERWKKYFPEATISFATEDYLSGKFPKNTENDNFWINAAVIPNEELIPFIKDLKEGNSLYINNIFIAYRGKEFSPVNSTSSLLESLVILENRWHLYQKNDIVLQQDFDYYTKDKKSQPLSKTNTLLGDSSQLFIEEGAIVECSILNVHSGPIYVGKEAEIMEGSVVRGGLAMAEHSTLKLATKVYGSVSLGPHCKVGGEVNNVIFQGYSNKGHDGFLGNSLVGEWCNLGADTNCSNLKNNYGNVKTYDYRSQKMEPTDVQFMGIAMGDYSKTSINTMLNTASVIGVCANIFIGDFPPKFVDNYSWGGKKDSPLFQFDKAVEAANKMMGRRGLHLSKEEKSILQELFPKQD